MPHRRLHVCTCVARAKVTSFPNWSGLHYTQFPSKKPGTSESKVFLRLRWVQEVTFAIWIIEAHYLFACLEKAAQGTTSWRRDVLHFNQLKLICTLLGKGGDEFRRPKRDAQRSRTSAMPQQSIHPTSSFYLLAEFNTGSGEDAATDPQVHFIAFASALLNFPVMLMLLVGGPASLFRQTLGIWIFKRTNQPASQRRS